MEVLDELISVSGVPFLDGAQLQRILLQIKQQMIGSASNRVACIDRLTAPQILIGCRRYVSVALRAEPPEIGITYVGQLGIRCGCVTSQVVGMVESVESGMGAMHIRQPHQGWQQIGTIEQALLVPALQARHVNR